MGYRHNQRVQLVLLPRALLTSPGREPTLITAMAASIAAYLTAPIQ